MKKWILYSFLITTLLYPLYIFANQGKIENRTSIRQIKSGDLVYVRPLYILADSVFTQPEAIAKRNQLTQYKHVDHVASNSIRPSHIRMTWIDYENSLRAFAEKHSLPLKGKDDRIRAAAKMYQLTGVRPLRHGQVLLSLPSIFENIYNIKDVGFTQNTYSDFFRVNESVIFERNLNGIPTYTQGRIAAILPSGDVVVEKGLYANRLTPKDVFSMDRNYKNFPFELNEEVQYLYKVPNISFPNELAKIAGFSPAGDAVIYLFKTKNFLKITAEDLYDEQKSLKKTSKEIETTAAFCPTLFLGLKIY